jgi:DNA-binding beta-propeller fold protein YncE
MRNALRIATLLSLCSPMVVGCGGDRDYARLTVQLVMPAAPALDPFQGGDRVSLVRVSVTGPESGDFASVDLAAGATTATLEAFPIPSEEADRRTLDIKAEALDDAGNLLAYGRALEVAFDGETEVAIQFRRSIAYVAHQAICGFGCGDEGACVEAGAGFECRPRADDCGACGSSRACVIMPNNFHRCRSIFSGSTQGPSHLYALDVFNRNIIERIKLPGTDPRALELTAYEGEAIVATMNDAGRGQIGILSTSDHSWRTGEIKDPAGLPLSPTHAALGRGQAVGVAGGGGHIVIFDAQSFATLSGRVIPGSIRDMAVGLGGDRAVVVVTQEPFVFLVDLSDPTAADAIKSPATFTGGGGVAISEDGRLAYVTSDTDGSVLVVDLLRGISRGGKGRFGAPVRQVIHSSYNASLLAVQAADEPGAVRDALLWTTDALFERGYGQGVGKFHRASGVAGIPGGRRALIVSASTSTFTASLTTIDLSRDQTNPMAAAKAFYPADPEERKVSGVQPGPDCRGSNVTNAPENCRIYEYQRYQPRSIAIPYGS